MVTIMALSGCTIANYIIQPEPLSRCGIISSNEVWSGIVYVDGDVIIPDAVTLYIEPGTHIIFASKDMDKSKLKLIIYGNLIAEGSRDKQIRFGSDYARKLKVNGWWSNSTWAGIVISVKNRESKNILEHCIIDNAYIGISIIESEAKINECQILGCEQASVRCIRSRLVLKDSQLINGQYGLLGDSASVFVENNVIRNHQFGIGGSIADGQIMNNLFRDDAGGIDFQVITDNVEISNNRFINCACAITLGLYNVNVSINDNDLTDILTAFLFRGDGSVNLKRNKLKRGNYGVYIEKESQIFVNGSINDDSDPNTNMISYMHYGNVYPYDYVLQKHLD